MTILLLLMFDSDVSVIYTKAELVTENRIQYKLNQKSKTKWKDAGSEARCSRKMTVC